MFIALIVLLLRGMHGSNYDLLSLILFPILLCSIFIWNKPKDDLLTRICQIVFISIAAFCFWGDKTILSILIPLFCGISVWGGSLLLRCLLKNRDKFR